MAQRHPQSHLAVIQNQSVMPSPGEWALMHDMAKSLLPTGFLPNTIKTPEQAVAIMLKGRELHIPPMYALSNIVVIQGKPSCNAELMLALVQRDHGEKAMWVRDTGNDGCTVAYRSGDGIKTYTFTVQDAERAGLTRNPTWKQYPAAMCRARAISAVARMAFPASIGGMYSPGELGDPVTVDEDGTVISTLTGEIHEEAPVARLDAPTRDPNPVSGTRSPAREPRAPEPNTEADWKRAAARFHAVLNELGVKDDGKRAWLTGHGVSSTKNVSAGVLREWATEFEHDPEGTREQIAALLYESAMEGFDEEAANAEIMEGNARVIPQGQREFDDEMMPGTDIIPDPDRHTQ